MIALHDRGGGAVALGAELVVAKGREKATTIHVM